jgi:hypothetical protein
MDALVAKTSVKSAIKNQSNLQVAVDKNRKKQKFFISFSHIELRESEIKNRTLFSTQTRMSAQ